MKMFCVLFLGCAFLINSCNSNRPASNKMGDGKSSSVCPANTGMASKQVSLTGVVLDTINTAGYTYVFVKTSDANVWVASPQSKLTIGDTIDVMDVMPMKDYHSKTLNRTFDLVYFAGGIVKKGDANSSYKACAMKPAASPMEQISLQGAMGHTPQMDPGVKADFTKIKKVPNGNSVAELFAQKETLKGKKVVLCGVIVHANDNIMNKNWLHLRDGTGNEGANDIIVTTKDNPIVGQIVVAEGTLSKDKDIGAGYKFALMIEDAKVTVQK